MAFLRAFISSNKETWAMTDFYDCEITSYIPDGDYATDLDDEEIHDLAIELDADVSAIEATFRQVPTEGNCTIKTGYVGYLTAPGYLDRTEPVVGDTPASVAEQLIDLYFDCKIEELDLDELEDLEWLALTAGMDDLMKEAQAEIEVRKDFEQVSEQA
jgi:hypothetical protein